MRRNWHNSNGLLFETSSRPWWGAPWSGPATVHADQRAAAHGVGPSWRGSAAQRDRHAGGQPQEKPIDDVTLRLRFPEELCQAKAKVSLILGTSLLGKAKAGDNGALGMLARNHWGWGRPWRHRLDADRNVFDRLRLAAILAKECEQPREGPKRGDGANEPHWLAAFGANRRGWGARHNKRLTPARARGIDLAQKPLSGSSTSYVASIRPLSQ